MPRGTHPLSITVELTHSAACQPRYVAADGKCAFALRLYGSAEAPPTATAFDQLDEDQRRSGDDYSLEVSACTLRAAPPNASGYHVAVVGWDGTNSFIVRAEQMRVPLATSVCPALSGSGRPPREPEPRHSHAAVWLPADQRMVIFGGETLQTRRSLKPRPASPPTTTPTSFVTQPRAQRALGIRAAPARVAAAVAAPRRRRRRAVRDVAVRGRRRRRAGADENSTVAAAAAAGRAAPGYFVASYYETHEVAPLHPPARSGHTLARAPPTAAASLRAGGLLVFGGQLHPGGDGERMVANDLWLFDLTGCDGDGGWRQLHGAAEPPPRYQHAAATPAAAAGDDDSTAFLVFGGRTPAASLSEWSVHHVVGAAAAALAGGGGGGGAAAGAILSDVWRPSSDAAAAAAEPLAARHESGAWPARRYGHSASATGRSHEVILFGGYTREATPSTNGDAKGDGAGSGAALHVPTSDLWLFDASPDDEGSSSTRRWSRVLIGGAAPEARACHAAAPSADAIVIFGGTDALGNRLDDVWALRLGRRGGAMRWSELRGVDVGVRAIVLSDHAHHAHAVAALDRRARLRRPGRQQPRQARDPSAAARQLRRRRPRL